MTKLNNDQMQQVELLYKTFGRTEITRSEINDLVKSGKIKNPSWLKSDTYKVSRGVYSLPIDGQDVSPTLKDVPLENEQPKTQKADVSETVNQASYIVSSLTADIVPAKDNVFVPWGHFKDIKSPFKATRYHSLIVDPNSFPNELEITAKTDDGLIMGCSIC